MQFRNPAKDILYSEWYLCKNNLYCINTYVSGTNRAFTSFLIQTTPRSWRSMKREKVEKDDELTKRAADCATRTQASIVLENKVHKVMEFLPCFDFTRISIYGMKSVKINFSNNSIIEIKKKLTFHGVLM